MSASCVALLPARAQRSGPLLALGVFVLANGASALASGFSSLLAWRAMAGIGAGVYLALGIAAAAGVSAPPQRGKAIGVIMGGMAGGTVLGVPLSLLLAQQLGWTVALWLVAILGALALAGLLWKLPALPAAPATSLRRKLALLADGQVLAILLVSLLAAGWALQVPQNQQLLAVRARQGDGNLAIALNESALYLGSAIGAAAGGLLLLLDWPAWLLAAAAAVVAAAALLQSGLVRRS